MDLVEEDEAHSLGRGKSPQVGLVETARAEAVKKPGEGGQRGIGREGVHRSRIIYDRASRVIATKMI
jgi:hypothetical protein